MENGQKPQIIKNGLNRFNIIIFVVLLVGGLIFCILVLNNALTRPNEINPGDNAVNTNQTNFDEATEAQLNRLKPSLENSGTQTLPSGRINPFFE